MYVFGPSGGDTANGCRCDDCRRAVAEYERERSRRVVPAYVGADRARQHMRFLSDNGVGLKQVAKRSGVSHGALWGLMYGKPDRGGPSKRIRRETEEKILAVMPADRADGALVDAGPTWANVQTLLERGWTKAAISAAIGQGGRALQLGQRYVTASRARAVESLLDESVPPRRSRHGLHAVPEVHDQAEPERRSADLPDPFPIDLTLQEWRQRAACRMPDVPVWIFFPGRGDGPTVEAAMTVCGRCAVRVECLETHLDERDGIWGGTTGQQRREIRRKRGSKEPEHGTRRRYARGCKCDACRAANAAYGRSA